jgi:hypothetical protein
MAALTRAKAPVSNNDRPAFLDNDPFAISQHNEALLVAKANELLSSGEVNPSTGGIDECPVVEVRDAFNPGRVQFRSWEELKAAMNKARGFMRVLEDQWTRSGWSQTGAEAFKVAFTESQGPDWNGEIPSELPGQDGRPHDEFSYR